MLRASRVIGYKVVLVGTLLLSSVGYANNNDLLLEAIFQSFAKGAMEEISEHIGKETAKFYLEDRAKKQKKLAKKNLEETLSEIVFNWSDVVNKQDTDSLFQLYGHSVLYYGSKLSDKKCIQDKNSFYKRYPNFSQSIADVRYVEVANNLYRVFFNKFVQFSKSKPIKNYPSYLLIDTSYNSPLIIVEGDKITDKNLLKKYQNQ